MRSRTFALPVQVLDASTVHIGLTTSLRSYGKGLNDMRGNAAELLVKIQ